MEPFVWKSNYPKTQVSFAHNLHKMSSLLGIASRRLPTSMLHSILLPRLELAHATSFSNDSGNGSPLLLISTSSWF